VPVLAKVIGNLDIATERRYAAVWAVGHIAGRHGVVLNVNHSRRLVLLSRTLIAASGDRL